MQSFKKGNKFVYSSKNESPLVCDFCENIEKFAELLIPGSLSGVIDIGDILEIKEVHTNILGTYYGLKVKRDLENIPDNFLAVFNDTILNCFIESGTIKQLHTGPEPKNNDGNKFCFWCEKPTIKRDLLTSIGDYCKNCRK